MKKYWLMFAFVFIANSVFADCFFDNSATFLTLEKERIKEILGLTAEETSDSEIYKEVISTIKERYSIDLENDLKQLTILFSKDTSLLVFNCNIDTEKILSHIKNMIEAENWPYHKIDDFVLCGKKYPAIRINQNNNYIFYDKNTIIFCNNSAENNDSIKISENSDLANKIKLISNNYLYIGNGKNGIPAIQNISRRFDINLEKANHFLLYIKNKDLTLEADFDDSTTSEETANKINELLTPEQISKLNLQIKSLLESEKTLSYQYYKKDMPEILIDLYEFIYPHSDDILNSIKVSHSGNKVIINCDYETTLSLATTITYTSFFVPEIKKHLIMIKNKDRDRNRNRANAGISNPEVFKTLYVDNLPKDINELREKLKKCSLVDSVRFSLALYIHSKAKKIIDSIENSRNADGSIAYLKNKNTESIVRFINTIFQSVCICGENKDPEYVDFSTLQENNRKRECFKIQEAVELYNMDHTEIMTFPDIPLLLKEHYIKDTDVPSVSCEYQTVGDISRNGYIECKIHGNYQNRKPVPDKPEVIIHHGKMPDWFHKKSNNKNNTKIPPHATGTNQSPIPPIKSNSNFIVIDGVPIPSKVFYQESSKQNDKK